MGSLIVRGSDWGCWGFDLIVKEVECLAIERILFELLTIFGNELCFFDQKLLYFV